MRQKLTRAEMAEHEAREGVPALYVGTYGKYNDGDISGQWVDVASFDDYDDFIDYCLRLHADERDPELIYQDFQYFPRQLYSESGFGEEEFDAIKAYSELDDDERDAFDAYISIFDNYDVEEFHEKYIGQFSSDQDLAYYLIDTYGGLDELPRETLENYFDYDGYGRDASFDFHHVDGYYFWT